MSLLSENQKSQLEIEKMLTPKSFPYEPWHSLFAVVAAAAAAAAAWESADTICICHVVYKIKTKTQKTKSAIKSVSFPLLRTTGIFCYSPEQGICLSKKLRTPTHRDSRLQTAHSLCPTV